MRRVKKRSIKHHRIRWIIIIAVSLLFGIGVGGYFSVVKDLPSAESISFFMPPVATRVYDDNDSLIGEFFIERRELTSLDRVPDYLKNGLICIEDKLFYKHWGVDILGLLRALITNILHGKVVQGGSTITMQLARNMFLTMEQTMGRKLKEIALAIRIERAYTKDEILEKYLNQINFGQGRFGVATAAKYYFNKDISKLNLAECALLIAIPKSPETYSPYKNPELARQRRNLVLKKMLEGNVISPAEYEEAVNEPIKVVEQKVEKKVGEYFLEEIRRYLELKYGPEFLYRSGANIYTTMNVKIQKTAEEILEKHLAGIEKEYKFKNAKAVFDSIGVSDTLSYSPYLQGALVFADYHTGEIKALIGGRDFSQSKFNRATQARRQAGSAFKIFVFTAALDNGFTPADVVLDLPIVLEVPGMDSIYRPSNYDRKFMGPITLKQALKFSRNLAAIRLIRNIGPELVVKYAHNLGVKSPLLAVVSLALGSCEVSLMEMVSAVGTIANLGEKVPTTLIRKITARDGTLIEINAPIPEQKLSPQISYIMTNMMRAVVDGGTAYRARHYYKGPAAGKTGTTNNYSDAWFIGFTPKYVCGIWVGNDNNDRIYRGATGGNVCAPIWGELFSKIDSPPFEEFPQPPGLVKCKICSKTGLLANEYCPKPIEEVFVRGTEPKDSCDLHGFSEQFDSQSEFDNF
ncbi:MAG TPA: PBP1A family penicillin-binding protein [candidate division WOR-3 bacterium]|uniref:PBP1A family penicillin-binding protein n=1 Tax=candidate division WOR-3 bacterium TaxID=2052148 RepID=A0A9C9EMB5_UNCW3|nr:PBP1A family penicillin-binding protein [candidate division WOR-3 bacterium]